jgi:hypothetical protein
MTFEIVPAVNYVRQKYALTGATNDRFSARRAAEFDRWHAAELNKARADGWDAAVSCIRYEDGTPVEVVGGVNPYRAAGESNDLHNR